MMLEIFKQALLDKRCLTGRHKATERHFAPHAIGFTPDGRPSACPRAADGDASVSPICRTWA
jgi:hypothetical protein